MTTVKIKFPSKGALYRHLTDYEIAKRWKALEISHPLNPQYNHVYDWNWRDGLPMVYQLDDGNGVEWSESWQRLSFEMNAGIDPVKWTRSCWHDIAFHNKPENGFTDDPKLLKRNYITGDDVKTGLPLTQDKVRVCGNAVVMVTRIEGLFGVIETLDGNKEAPSLNQVMSRPWLWFHAVNTHMNRATKMPNISPFLFNAPKPYLFPLISRTEIRVFMPALQTISECPPNPDIHYPVDPYKTYIS